MNSRGVTGRAKEALILTKPAINVKKLNVPVSPDDSYVARTGASVSLILLFSFATSKSMMELIIM